MKNVIWSKRIIKTGNTQLLGRKVDHFGNLKVSQCIADGMGMQEVQIYVIYIHISRLDGIK